MVNTVTLAAPPREELLTRIYTVAQHRLPDQANCGRQATVRFKRNAIRSNRITINLLPGIRFEAARERVMQMPSRQSAWAGHVNGNYGSKVTLAASGDSVAAVFDFDGRMYKLEPSGNDAHIVTEVDSADPLPEFDPIPVFDSHGTGEASSATDSGDVIDVIDVTVVYTPATRLRYGGTSGAEALVALAIAETNQAYANSGVTTQLRLIHSEEVAHIEPGSMQTDLNRRRGAFAPGRSTARCLRRRHRDLARRKQ